MKEFISLLDERLDVQDVVSEAQNLLRLSRPVTAVYFIISQIIWYEIHVVETLTVVIIVKFYAMHTLPHCTHVSHLCCVLCVHCVKILRNTCIAEYLHMLHCVRCVHGKQTVCVKLYASISFALHVMYALCLGGLPHTTLSSVTSKVSKVLELYIQYNNNNHRFMAIIQVNLCVASTSSLELEDFVGANSYCPYVLADDNQRFQITAKTSFQQCYLHSPYPVI